MRNETQINIPKILSAKRKIKLCTEPTKGERYLILFRIMFKQQNNIQQTFTWLNQEFSHIHTLHFRTQETNKQTKSVRASCKHEP